MIFYLKERNGDNRILTIFGFRFSYNKSQFLRSRGKRKVDSFEAKCKKARIAAKYLNVFESISDGDVCLDCGCNAGSVSDVFLHKGAFVYAFEPHPYLFQLLSEKYHAADRVKLFDKAVWDRNTRMELHVQKVKKTGVVNLEGTSLFGDRVDAHVEPKCNVEVIDIVEFISNIGRRVKVLKIDVEGAEFEIIDKILNEEVYKRIDHVFCEVHPHFFTDGPERLKQLQTKIYTKGVTNIHLDWV
jgi:FkbM family methyltransferase